MNSEIKYEANQVLINEQAMQDGHYIDQQIKKADNTIKHGICLKLDVLSKDIMNLFNDEAIWQFTDPILIHLVFNPTNHGIHHIDFLNHQNELISTSSHKASDSPYNPQYNNNQSIQVFLSSLISNFEEISNTIRDFIPNPDQFIIVQQGNVGRKDDSNKVKIPFFKVHKATIYQDVQHVMNQFIQAIDPNYLRAKENYSLKYNVDPSQFSQKNQSKSTR